MKATTKEMKNLIQKLVTRGVEAIYPSKEFLEKKLTSGEKVTIYLGIDPTAPTLHLGHAIPLQKLREFQDLGHRAILLVGDFTARIGDPTGKLSTRKVLTKKEVKKNFASYRKQAGKIIRFTGVNSVQVKYNGSWHDRMKAAQLLEILGCFTTAQLLERDMFQERLKEGKAIHANEFLYPVLQAYDSVAMDVDGELGGNDQTFNMLRGRDLLKMLKQKDKFVLTTKLLSDNSGKKMGKSEGNMVTLVDSPDGMFGKIMSWNDDMIQAGFELCTDVHIPSETDIQNNPKEMKAQLAFEIVKRYHSEKKAKEAQEKWEKTFSKKERDVRDFASVQGKETIMRSLVLAGVVASNTEYRQLVKSGSITKYVTGEKIDDPLGKMSVEAVLGEPLKIGKKRFIKIIS